MKDENVQIRVAVVERDPRFSEDDELCRPLENDSLLIIVVAIKAAQSATLPLPYYVPQLTFHAMLFLHSSAPVPAVCTRLQVLVWHSW